MTVKPRSVTPIIAWVRDLVGQRTIIPHLRFEGFNVSPRTRPTACLPGGINHKLSDVVYLKRDGRRCRETPLIAYTSTKQIGQGENLKQFPLPGNVYAPPKV